MCEVSSDKIEVMFGFTTFGSEPSFCSSASDRDIFYKQDFLLSLNLSSLTNFLWI